MRLPLSYVRAGRYRTRTATTTTAASGRNREELLGPRSDFSRPRQGVAEKSANATRKAVSARCAVPGPVGTSTKKALPAGAPYAPPHVRAGRYRTRKHGTAAGRAKSSVSPSADAAAEGETLFCILLLRIAEERRRPVPPGGTQRPISRSRRQRPPMVRKVRLPICRRVKRALSA